jgi:hypothetical protein
MSDNTLRWKLFPFSLMGIAKQRYNLTIESMQGDWEVLCSKFCLKFFPISRVARLQIEVLTFKQHEKEPLDASWDRFNDLITTGPDLAILDLILLQHFYLGFSKDDAQDLNVASGGSFLSLSVSEARLVLDKILEQTTCTSIHDELLEEENESSPE